MTAPLILGTNSIKDEGYVVDNSLRFDDGSSDNLSITPASNGNARTGTFSWWFKRGDTGATKYFYGQTISGSGVGVGILLSSDEIYIFQYDGTSPFNPANYDFGLTSQAVFRDHSAWYHVVINIDTDNATQADRIKLWVNGVSQTLEDTGQGFPNQNLDTAFFQSATARIGSDASGGNNFDGYIAEFVGIDGTALDPTSFGEFDEDTNIWKPKDVSGLTFGTNGFYLDFENSGSLGADVSGNGNNFTANNLTSIDQVTDSPTNNFATMNPLDNYWSNGTLSNGNLTFLSDTTNLTYITSTIGVNSGKWYWEVEFDAKSGGSDSPIIGITSTQSTAGNQRVGNFPNDWGYSGYSPSAYVNNNTETSYGSSYTTNDIIGVALDLDNNKLYFSKNGTWQNSGDPTSGATGTGALSITDPSSTPLGFYFPAICYNNVSNTGTFNANFGSSAFSYTVPSGYYALNTKNLSEFG